MHSATSPSGPNSALCNCASSLGVRVLADFGDVTNICFHGLFHSVTSLLGISLFAQVLHISVSPTASQTISSAISPSFATNQSKPDRPPTTPRPHPVNQNAPLVWVHPPRIQFLRTTFGLFPFAWVRIFSDGGETAIPTTLDMPSIASIMRYFEDEISGIDGSTATFVGYCLDNSSEIDPNRKRPSVLVIPGGGYEMTSDREARLIASAILTNEANAFVLRYSVKPSIFRSRCGSGRSDAADPHACRRMALRCRRDRGDRLLAGGHTLPPILRLPPATTCSRRGVSTIRMRPNGLMLYRWFTSGPLATAAVSMRCSSSAGSALRSPSNASKLPRWAGGPDASE